MKKRIGSFLYAFIITAAAVRTAAVQTPEVQFPQTPAGKATEAYFKAFNAGEEAMAEFINSYTAREALQRLPFPEQMNRYRQIRGRLESLVPWKVIDSRQSSLSVAARAQNGQLLRFDFEFESAEPFGLRGIRVGQLASGPEGLAPRPEPKKDDAELIAAVRDDIRASSRTGDFSGVILIARKGVPIYEEAFGYADREKEIPNRTDTKFNVGSINKSFTSLAVRKLAAENRLSLDDTIGKFLPDYPNKDASARVTVRHLLEMSSGIGDFFGDRYDAADKEKIQSLADYLPLFADRPLEFEPGQGNLYSNGGYIVLGLIIEKVTGTDYYSHIRDTVFKPAGMADSEWTAKSATVPNRAIGYLREGSGWKTNYDTLPGIGSSAGGGYSTARDLLNYTIALGKGVFGEAGEDRKDGMGIAGGAPGINAALEWMPDRGYTIVVVSNLSPPAAMRVAQRIRDWLPR